MKLYVCWGTFATARPGGHPCRNAHEALAAAGHHPDIVKSYGLGVLPDALNATRGRREVRELTGQPMVPVLVNDEGEPIAGSREIATWARAHPAATAA
jgi:glutathione S-transferase-like protein